MSSKIIDETVCKLVILFVFDKMEVPLTEKTLLDICSTDNDWLNYMDCKETLAELISSGLILNSSTSANGQLYSITPDGRTCLAHFFIRIPSSTRNEIVEFIRVNRMKYRKRQDYFSDYYKNQDGTYSVILKIIEPDRTIMEMKLIVPDRHKAKWIYKNWEENAAQVYSTIYSTLVE